MNRAAIFVAALSALFATVPTAAEAESGLLLRSGRFDPVEEAGRPALELLVPEQPLRKSVVDRARLVQFRRPVTRSDRRELIGRGVRIVGHVPRHGLLVLVPDGSADVLAGLDDLRFAGALRAEQRVEPGLLARVVAAEADATLDVLLFPGEAPDPIAAAIRSRFASARIAHVKRLGSPALLVELTGALRPLVAALASDPAVLFVAERSVRNTNNDDAVWVGQSYDLASGPREAGAPPPAPYSASATIWNRGLRGEGQIVAVADTGLEHALCAFADPENPVVPQTVAPPAPLVLDPAHRKILAYNAPNPFGFVFDDTFRHGTHVSGTLAGDDLAHPATALSAGHDHGDGVAPAARLVFQDISGNRTSACSTSISVASIEELLEQEYAAGARISNNSWSSSAGIYDAGAYESDAAGRRHEDMLVVFSAGNDGSAGLGGISQCKNCLVVGASENYDDTHLDVFGILDPENMAAFSSRGPTADGRIKPDLVAPGYLVDSAQLPFAYFEDTGDPACDPGDADVCFPSFGGCYVTDSSATCHVGTLLGTSMAAPQVSGLGALARQYFTEGFYPDGAANPGDGRQPSAALLKAVLINGARNMTGRLYERRGVPSDVGPLADAPSPVQGWGRAMLDDALYFTGDARKLFVIDVPNAVGVATGEAITVPLTVTASTQPLEATLVWSDEPALPVVAGALVNDLDLVITAPDGTVYRGNQWTTDDPDVPGDKVSLPSAPGKDDTNNVEGILLPSAAPGVYAISVVGAGVPGGAGEPLQGAALVVTGAVASCPAPPAPEAIAAELGAFEAGLVWQVVPGALGYRVLRNTTACSAPMAADVVFDLPAGATGFVDETVLPESSYFYSVRAIVSADGCETADSSCVEVTTPAPGPPPVPDGVFGAPLLATRGILPDSIELSWDAVSCTAAGYHLIHGTIGSFDSVEGGLCELNSFGTDRWDGVPAGDLWFLVVGNDAAEVEGSWGDASDGTPRGGGPSGVCGIGAREDSTGCGASRVSR